MEEIAEAGEEGWLEGEGQGFAERECSGGMTRCGAKPSQAGSLCYSAVEIAASRVLRCRTVFVQVRHFFKRSGQTKIARANSPQVLVGRCKGKDCSMRRSMAIVLAACLTAFLGASVQAAEEGWLVDFAAAKEQAAKEGKDILMEFTGSDWCPPCKALKSAVLDSEVFKTKAPEKFILLKIDNPRDKSKQTPAEIAQYTKLAGEFKIQGVPTIILADAKGRPYSKTVGFGGQKADEYVDKLVSNQDSRTKRDETFAKAEKATGGDKAKLLDEAIAVVDAELAVAQYRDVVDEIVKLDAANEGGLKAKYEGIITTAEIRGALQEIVKNFTTEGPEASIKKMDELIENKKLTGASLQEVLVMKAQIYFRTDKAKAKETFEAAAKAAPESPIARQITAFVKAQFPDEPAKEPAGDGASEKKSE